MVETIIVETAPNLIGEKSNGSKDGPCWYALYTKPRCEKKVKERLEQQGWDVYLPLLTSIRQWSDRKKKVQFPLIPGIVFVNTQRSLLSSVLMCEGVSSVIRYLGEPALVREYEIANLRILLREPDLVGLIEPDEPFEEGVQVRVVRGPFIGLIGSCIRKQGRHSLVVEIGALKSRLKLTLPVSFVESTQNSLVKTSGIVLV